LVCYFWGIPGSPRARRMAISPGSGFHAVRPPVSCHKFYTEAELGPPVRLRRIKRVWSPCRRRERHLEVLERRMGRPNRSALLSHSFHPFSPPGFFSPASQRAETPFFKICFPAPKDPSAAPTKRCFFLALGSRIAPENKLERGAPVGPLGGLSKLQQHFFAKVFSCDGPLLEFLVPPRLPVSPGIFSLETPEVIFGRLSEKPHFRRLTPP